MTATVRLGLTPPVMRAVERRPGCGERLREAVRDALAAQRRELGLDPELVVAIDIAIPRGVAGPWIDIAVDGRRCRHTRRHVQRALDWTWRDSASPPPADVDGWLHQAASDGDDERLAHWHAALASLAFAARPDAWIGPAERAAWRQRLAATELADRGDDSALHESLQRLLRHRCPLPGPALEGNAGDRLDPAEFDSVVAYTDALIDAQGERGIELRASTDAWRRWTHGIEGSGASLVPAWRDRWAYWRGLRLPELRLGFDDAQRDEQLQIRLYGLSGLPWTAAGDERPPLERLVACLDETVQEAAAALVTPRLVEALVDACDAEAPAVVDEARRRCGAGGIGRVLAALADEGVPLRDVKSVLAALAEHRAIVIDPAHFLVIEDAVALSAPPAGGTVDTLPLWLRSARRAMRGLLTRQLSDAGNTVRVWLLASDTEQALREGRFDADADAGAVDGLLDAIHREIGTDRPDPPALLTSGDVRAALRRVVEGELPQVSVVAYEELLPDTSIVVDGRIAATP